MALAMIANAGAGIAHALDVLDVARYVSAASVPRAGGGRSSIEVRGSEQGRSSRKPLPRTESLLVEHLCRDAISNLIGLFNCGLARAKLRIRYSGELQNEAQPLDRLATQPEPFDE